MDMYIYSNQLALKNRKIFSMADAMTRNLV